MNIRDRHGKLNWSAWGLKVDKGTNLIIYDWLQGENWVIFWGAKAISMQVVSKQ